MVCAAVTAPSPILLLHSPVTFSTFLCVCVCVLLSHAKLPPYLSPSLLLPSSPIHATFITGGAIEAIPTSQMRLKDSAAVPFPLKDAHIQSRWRSSEFFRQHDHGKSEPGRGDLNFVSMPSTIETMVTSICVLHPISPSHPCATRREPLSNLVSPLPSATHAHITTLAHAPPFSPSCPSLSCASFFRSSLLYVFFLLFSLPPPPPPPPLSLRLRGRRRAGLRLQVRLEVKWVCAYPHLQRQRTSHRRRCAHVI